MHLSRICKLYPSKKDVTLLNHWLEESLDVYNYYSRKCILLFNNRDHVPSIYSLQRDLTELKKSTNKYQDINRHILNNVLFKLDESWKSFWAKKKKKVKTKRDYQAKPPRQRKTWNILNLDNGFKIENNKLFISEIGKGKRGFLAVIPFRQSDLFSERYLIKNITIKKVRNKWFLHLTYNIPEDFLKKTQSEGIVAFDWGISHFLTGSDGSTIEEPKFILDREKKHIITLQKRQSNQKRSSKGYQKTWDKISVIKNKEYKRKMDYYWKTSLNLTSNFGTICIEDLTLSDLRLKRMNHGKSMNRQSPSIFFNCLEHQAKKYKCDLIKVNPYHTSKTCNDCGYVKEDMTQKDRNWTCPNCGSYHNRDHNAAKNILLLGLYTLGIRGSACEVKDLVHQIGDCF